MYETVLTNYSKSQVEQMTKKALNIISSGNSNLLQTEKEDDEE